jgi:hypothetical protein
LPFNHHTIKGEKTMKAKDVGELLILGGLAAAVMLTIVACGLKEQEQTDIPPGPEPTALQLGNGHTVFVESFERHGARCVVVRVKYAEQVEMSCDWSRPPIYGEVESAAQVASSGCTTDTDCMEKFGGDGSPMPLHEYLRQQRATEF